MKKFLTTLLTVALTATLAISGTLAYLQSEDSDVNVMTLGNVKIKQHEYQRVEENGGYKTDKIDEQTSYVLEAFEQGKALLPIVGDPSKSGDEYAGWDSIPVRMSQVGSYGGMDVFAGKNAQDKFVTVENTGRDDAYVRTLVAIEVGTADADLVGSSYHLTWTQKEIGYISIDGNTYYVTEYVYNGAELSDGSWRHQNGILPAGETSYPNLSQVYLKSEATNEDMEKIDGNGNGTLDILVLSQAVQADGFANAEVAFENAFPYGEDNANVAEWFGGMGNVQYVEADGAKYQMEDEEAAEVLALLQDGMNLIVDKDMDIIAFDTNEVDAQGATVTLQGVGSEAYGYLAFMPDAGENVTLRNLNVTGSGFVEVGHYGQGNGNYTVENLVMEDFASTLANSDKGNTIGCAFMGFGTTTLNNCVITGNTAVQDGVTPISLGCGNGLTTTVNGGEYDSIYCWSHSYTTIDGAEVDTIYAAPIKGNLTIKAGTHVDTLNIDYGTSSTYATKTNLAKIVIEEGATVGKIVFDGSDYTQSEWPARANAQ